MVLVATLPHLIGFRAEVDGGAFVVDEGAGGVVDEAVDNVVGAVVEPTDGAVGAACPASSLPFFVTRKNTTPITNTTAKPADKATIWAFLVTSRLVVRQFG